MLTLDLRPLFAQQLRQTLGVHLCERLQTGVPLARFTAARLGGPAEALLEVNSSQELEQAVLACWQAEIPWTILGSGSNVLVSDQGVRGLVLINRARQVRFLDSSPSLSPPFREGPVVGDTFGDGPGVGREQPGVGVWAESGASFGLLARQAAERMLSGLEWAAGIPGTLGGAVVGNAGAHGGDMAGNLALAEILHLTGWGDPGRPTPQRETWTVERFEYSYRSSAVKRLPGAAVVLAAWLKLQPSAPQAVQARMEEYTAYRKRTQPPGASMGSMFKNPPGDYAGRLIEAAGLKGASIGGAQISSLHANFFLNSADASATDIYHLIELARRRVADRFGVELELEIELLGEWSDISQ